MAKATTRLTNDALAFLTERHLAMLTTLRSDTVSYTHLTLPTNREV